MLRLAYPFFYRGEDLDAAIKFWQRDLGYIENDDIMKAMELVTDAHPKKAPTIGEFKLLCRKVRADRSEPVAKIAMHQVCSSCLSDLRSQRHVDICGEV